jgi:riboflavin kinase/FMN adenylyltransferase
VNTVVVSDSQNVQNNPTAVAIGNFDGVHLGHRLLIERMCKTAAEIYAEPSVMTFKPLPSHCFGMDIKLITTYEERTKLIAALGVKNLFEVCFDIKFASYTPEQFISEYLVKRLNAKAVLVGDDFRFAKDRSGDTKNLGEFCAQKSIYFESIPKLWLDGGVVSSTSIRELVLSGEVAEAARLLGRYFSRTGKVTNGEGVGRKIGFPTANIEAGCGLVPADGVYGGIARLNGKLYQAMIYVGVRPTINGSKRRFEVNLLGYSGDEFYGETITVEFVSFIRPEIKFNSLAELERQIKADRKRIENDNLCDRA